MNQIKQKQILKRLEDAQAEIQKSARDQLIFGVSVAEFSEDGTVRRIDPNSKEGQEIIKQNKEVK